QVNPKIVQTLLVIPPIALATGAAFLLLSTAISKVLMLVGPLLSANALIFKSLGAIAGANVKAASVITSSATQPLIRFQQEQEKIQQAITAQEVVYSKAVQKVLESTTKTREAARIKEVKEANKLAALIQKQSFLRREIPLVAIIESSAATLIRNFARMGSTIRDFSQLVRLYLTPATIDVDKFVGAAAQLNTIGNRLSGFGQNNILKNMDRQLTFNFQD